MLQKGWDCDFKGSSGAGPCCRLSYKGDFLSDMPLSGNLCYLNIRFLRPDELNVTPVYKEICALTSTDITTFTCTPVTWDLWHACMGHPGGESVKRLPYVATGVSIDTKKPLGRCEACIVAKHPHKPYPPSSSPRVQKPLDLVHSDLCGPFPVRTPHGKLYFIIFLDDHSNLLNVQLLASKDQALDAWRVIRALWKNHVERRVMVFHSDNGGEFVSGQFTKALQDAGIERQLASPYAHQQNGKAEHAIRTLQGRALAMLETSGSPLNLWGEAILTAVYLWNRTESNSLPAGVIPYEIINHRKPDLSHLRVFGSRCWARIPTELLKQPTLTRVLEVK
jgi:hypothetical protein